ncbi:polysaccharide biosynthesis protein [Trichococcus palustris]|uniref:Polysaccharide biosynthesis protein n=1 Tax=Trichococcus palustris TaxID=140314 RepID=A0A143YR62_9LACT|nr:oligosaccharide flippase family protein [Trichococcus palustris]CZQ96577.1 polysaccharide biosynthesis protein [Trichococcus palustris]SFK73935.1 Membrane protein involved in the export of O-antigen and teichoic acid [Trichococcus palustris]
MRIQRTKNAGRNILFGIILKIYQVIMPFIMRTVMIYHMGILYAGLNSLFSSVLQVLNLAELGIGAAMIYSMYEPIANDDKDKICKLLNLYRKLFRYIGIVVLCIGLVLLPFIPKVISGKIPGELNVFVLYMMYLGVTILSYWLFAYKNSLLYAHQRTDISSKVILITNTFQYILQLITLLIFKNYYYYLAVSIITQVTTNMATAIIVNKMYPEYKARGKVDKSTLQEIKKSIQGLVTNKIGGTILNSADTIVISAFLGLSALAIYQNYYFIISAVISIVYIIYQASLAGIGNSLIIENSEKNYADFKTMTFIIFWIVSFCSSAMLVLLQPFMKIWMGEKNLIDYSLVVCMVIYFFVYEIDQLIGTYKDAAGIWYKDRYRPLFTALLNLCLNLILVQFIGLYGVLFSTIISMLVIGIPWLIKNLFNSVFQKESPWLYTLIIFKYAILAVLTNATTFFICSIISDEGILSLLSKLILCILIHTILNLCIFYKNPEFKRTCVLINKMSGNRLSVSAK